ncbi:4'-phosphopantetheinyl transferase family protein [Methylocapsa acidiphila]|uniref:4'-phosphopantetheinyl transferase family protein n=1 Tax=Methylocapsa acidiphila TaxID=133552 RepID=UPI0003F64B0F|nr:4'-phosphopantetheinyl transferase superfamily protein [Methylocapsa acidiphila]
MRRLPAKGLQAELWLLSRADTAGLDSALACALSEEEIKRANRFFRAEDHSRFLSARAALRSLLGAATGRAPKDISFVTGEFGKPRLAGDPAPHFNVSHSGAFALIGISDRQIGVDIELMRDKVEELDLARSFFSVDEHRFLAGLAQPARRAGFYRIWTAKEAVLKALGLGIANHLRDFSIEATQDGFNIRPENKSFASNLATLAAMPLTAPEGYAAAAAVV